MGNPELTNGKSPAVTIPAELQLAAVAVWESSAKDFFGKGGIRDMQDKIAEKISAGVGKGLHNLAVACQNFNAADAVHIFEGACAFAESKARKAAHDAALVNDPDAKAPGIRELLPTWANAKSVILSGMKAKYDISDRAAFPTVSSINTALTEARKAKGREPQPPVLKVKFTEKLQATMNALQISLAALTADQQDSISGEVMILTHKADSMRSAPAVVTETVALTAEARKQAAMRGGSRAAA
jgi:hypothetical protein